MKKNHVVPVESIYEELTYIKSMFCPSCKKNSCETDLGKYTISTENGYDYKIRKISCTNCSYTFQIMFFNTNPLDDLKKYDP